MPVSLKIISYKGQPYHNGDAVMIDKEGGIIGRLDTCDLVLPDKEKIISRHHATVKFENNVFMLSDTSLGGTYIDDDPSPLHESSIELLDGMLLRIGDYQIQVNLIAESHDNFPEYQAEDLTSGPFSGEQTNPFDEDNALFNPSAPAEQPPPLLPEDDFLLEPDQANPFVEDHDDSFVSSTESHENYSTLHDSFIPPAPTGERHASDEIPEDFNFEDLFNLEQEPSPERPTPAKSEVEPSSDANALLDGRITSPPESAFQEAERESPIVEPSTPDHVVSAVKQPSANLGNLYQAFLQGADLNLHEAINPEQQEDRLRRIGSMFRQFVESTVAVLRSRAEFKSLFRVTVTTIKKTDNNPLKFSVTTDEAIEHLLNDGQGGFKKSVDAIDEGFQDLLNHQMAIQAGIQASLLELLRQFDPDRIEKLYEEGLVLNKKAKCWEKYREVYNQMAEHAVDDFYGDAFADAYELQMKQIMAVNQKNQ